MEYIIDAGNKKLGRVASEIALVLQGKNSPGFDPRLPGVSRVIVKNASKITVSGRKAQQKIYYRHTGYIGHLKKRTFADAFKRSPERVLFKAVFNMLPKNRLRAKRLKRLKIES